VDRNPAFTKVVGNFSALDYMRLSTISAVSVTVGYLSGSSPSLDSPPEPCLSQFTPTGSSEPGSSCRDQAGDPGPVDGDGRPHRGHGRVHVRVPELRGAPHGILPQRRRGRALQVQAVVRIHRPLVASQLLCLLPFLTTVSFTVLDLGTVWPWLNKYGMLLHSYEDLMIQFSSSCCGLVRISSPFP
jgi:hypothetical protein